ncbi:MAG: 16S rRNA (guanine(527)-N(7))-methyltransferase RsmG [Proteobacteria bacterium]|nr:16S rRNA (guanine(527)-N(7))-methyltransferase RsmG [Pseudomonadota bacterium]
MNTAKSKLLEGLSQLNLNLQAVHIEKLLQFLQLLDKWNQHFNLTSITDSEKMISHHLLDSLSAAPFIEGNSVLDVGTGAGFPGVPLAILFPHIQWTLLDSNGKKTRFLTQAKIELALTNIEVVQARVEYWQPVHLFDVVVTRAVATIKKIISQTMHTLSDSGYWLFMKSGNQHEALASLSSPPVIHTIKVPGIAETRYIIAINRSMIKSPF